jgi:hypothetical protein
VNQDTLKILRNTFFWGFIIWLFGYILGFVFFAFVPKQYIGWCILPFGVLFTLWILLKKVYRERFTCYIGLGVIWTVMAVVLDFLFIVRLLHSTDYYRLDVYVYYLLTLSLPIIVGAYKFRKK